jgi:hypothetical protein
MLCVGIINPPTPAHAAWDTLLQRISSSTPAGETHVDSAESLIGTVQEYVFGIVLTMTFIATMLSGIKFGLARGDVKAYQEAQRALTYSVVAFLLAAGAFFIRGILLRSLGAPDLGPSKVIK